MKINIVFSIVWLLVCTGLGFGIGWATADADASTRVIEEHLSSWVSTGFSFGLLSLITQLWVSKKSEQS